MKLWLDAQCAAFVREEFPEYVAAYEGLQLAVERADLFRYLVVLRHGGLYSDTDTEVWNLCGTFPFVLVRARCPLVFMPCQCGALPACVLGPPAVHRRSSR